MKEKKGFTLIELIVSMVIISVVTFSILTFTKIIFRNVSVITGDQIDIYNKAMFYYTVHEEFEDQYFYFDFNGKSVEESSLCVLTYVDKSGVFKRISFYMNDYTLINSKRYDCYVPVKIEADDQSGYVKVFIKEDEQINCVIFKRSF